MAKWPEAIKFFLQKCSIIDVWQICKYTYEGFSKYSILIISSFKRWSKPSFEIRPYMKLTGLFIQRQKLFDAPICNITAITL